MRATITGDAVNKTMTTNTDGGDYIIWVSNTNGATWNWYNRAGTNNTYTGLPWISHGTLLRLHQGRNNFAPCGNGVSGEVLSRSCGALASEHRVVDPRVAAAAAAAAAEAERQRQAAAAAATAAAEAERQRQAAAAAAAAAAEAERQRQAAQACPALAPGSTLRDQTTGAVYAVDNGKLRWFPTSEVYESWGSPASISTPSVNIGNCPKGENMPLRPPITLGPMPTESLPPSTPGPTIAPTATSAPATGTPQPLSAPTAMLSEADIIAMLPNPGGTAGIPARLSYPSTLCILIHRHVWVQQGRLAVLALRNGTARLERFQYRDPSQVWALSNNGSLRVMSGSGLYLSVDEQCMTPTTSPQFTRSSMWTLAHTGGHDLQYQVMARCNKPLGADRNSLSLAAPAVMSHWFIVPIATVGA